MVHVEISGKENNILWLTDKKIFNHAQDKVPYYDDIRQQNIDMDKYVVNYNINAENIIGGKGVLINKSVRNNFNFYDCNIRVQGCLNDLAQLLNEKGKKEEAREFEALAGILEKAEQYKTPEEMKKKVNYVSKIVDIENRLDLAPYSLSGGQKQRVAIVRAMVNNPKLLLADEPTGSVDAKTADYIFDVFTELNKEGQTILIVTHDVALSRKVRRVVAIRDGKISSERVLKEKYADRLKESNIDWHTEETQEEFAIVDKAGRVQIPAELLKEIGLKDNKVSVAVKDGKVVLSRPQNVEDDTKAGTE